MFNDFVESLRATPTPTWIVEQPAVSQLSRANAVPHRSHDGPYSADGRTIRHRHYSY